MQQDDLLLRDHLLDGEDDGGDDDDNSTDEAFDPGSSDLEEDIGTLAGQHEEDPSM